MAALRSLLEARDPATAQSESVLETRVARILRRARIRGWEQQHEISVAGRFVARVDFAFPEQLLAIEADGYAWHSGRYAWQRDRARLNALTNLGWRVIHVTATDLAKPGEVTDRIEQALRAR